MICNHHSTSSLHFPLFVSVIYSGIFLNLDRVKHQEFLKKEFSHENIYFWAACERFHRLFPSAADQQNGEERMVDDAAARLEAQKIFERHLGPAASEPVNVDSQARQTAEDHLDQPGPELFDQVRVLWC